MKLKVEDQYIVSTAAVLTAISTTSFVGGEVRYLDGDLCVFYLDAIIGGYKPDNDDNGYWEINNKTVIQYISVVDDAYDFAGNNATEIDDIVTAEKFGLMLFEQGTPGFRFKLSVRSMLKTLIYTKMTAADEDDTYIVAKQDLLTDAEKYIAAHWWLVKDDVMLLAINSDDKYWTNQSMDYRLWSKDEREKILATMEALVFRRIKYKNDAIQVLADLDQILKDSEQFLFDAGDKLTQKVQIKRLSRQYVSGIESNSGDGQIAIRDYIAGTASTPFEFDSFKDLTVTFQGAHTATTVSVELLEIIDKEW